MGRTALHRWGMLTPLMLVCIGCNPEHDTFELWVDVKNGNPTAAEVVVTGVGGRFPLGTFSFRRASKDGPADGIFTSFRSDGCALRLVSAAPLRPGETYVAEFTPKGGDGPETFAQGIAARARGRGRLVLEFEVPLAAQGTDYPTVAFHPTSRFLPANHLKFYLAFSQPMEQGVFMERIQLLRDDGNEVRGAFRETELWSPDGKRLTVWLHPGRQKTGVNLNEDEGMVLQEGGQFTLKIDGRWRAANGEPLGKDQVKTFHVIAADHSPVNISRWRLSRPRAGTLDSLTVTFPDPLDWALLQNSIAVQDGRGQRIAGEIRVPDGEMEWRFTPVTAWQAGGQRIAIDKRLEDLAGNNLDRPFEVDLDRPKPPPSSSMAFLPFDIDH